MLRNARNRRSDQKALVALTSGSCVKSPNVLSKIIRSVGHHLAVGLGLIGLAFATTPATAATASLSSCAWPIEVTPEGFGNILIPETVARDWIMPIDPQWVQVTIKGTFPNARYMSLVAYNGETPTGVAGGLFDAQIIPDPGNVNPFVPPRKRGTRNYTISISRTQTQGANVITVAPGAAWFVYRLYLPNSGENSMGGVPVPNVTVTDQNGAHPLPTCTRVNLVSDINNYLNVVLGPQFNVPEISEPPATTDRLWFAPPDKPTIFLFPNPDNKYMFMEFPGPFQPGRIIVIRGKAPSFPDTYNGKPIWRPADDFNTVQLRFWSLCHADFVSPFPIVQCTADQTTKLDKNGFYTVVITDDRIAPDWLPADTTWLPFGDEQLSKWLIFRNMLPASRFRGSVQNAIAHGCTFKQDLPNLPSVQEFEQAGRCAEGVMGAYYPIAAWCNQSTFTVGGAEACLKGQ